MSRVCGVLIAVVLTGCLDSSHGAPTTAAAPLVGVDGSTDSADRSCNVILRQMTRETDGNGNPIDQGGSWVMDAQVEISADAAAAGLEPALLYQIGDTSWLSATGSAAAEGSTPGYVRYDFQIVSTATSSLQAIPYLALPGGGRLFDHNRNTDDLADYTLAAPDFAVWGAPAVCASPTDARAATITFAADFTQTVAGVIVPGGTISIAYDAARAPTCRDSQGGNPLWDVTAHVQFDAGEPEIDVSVRDAAATVTVPTDGAHSVAIWFENTDASGCRAWDSNLGNNYVFAVETPPQWFGLPTNLLTRDESQHCAGGADAATGFSFDTWARVEAFVTNLCFEVYQPGETDNAADTSLWQQLDVSVVWRLDGANGVDTAWTTTPVAFDATVGNNAQYAFSWRTIDPFRDYHCPEVASVPTPNDGGMYQQIGVEYYVEVNGAALRAESGAAFGGTFIDYPSNPWRTANCP